MNTRKIALAVAAGAALMAAAPAFAHDRHDGWRGHGPRHHAQYYHRAPGYVYAPSPVMVAPRPYYYAPPARVYYAPPAPVYYAPPAPVVYGSVPVGGARVNFGVRF